jgi:hypothetical protein
MPTSGPDPVDCRLSFAHLTRECTEYYYKILQLKLAVQCTLFIICYYRPINHIIWTVHPSCIRACVYWRHNSQYTAPYTLKPINYKSRPNFFTRCRNIKPCTWCYEWCRPLLLIFRYKIRFTVPKMFYGVLILWKKCWPAAPSVMWMTLLLTV